jgi:hypothetical protein
MKRLGEILDRTVQQLPLRRRLDDYAIWEIWDDAVGPTVARNARPEKIRNDTLFVKVRGATWMQQLQYMKDIIMETLNQRLGREVVANIFFVVGDIPPSTPPKDTDTPVATVDTTRLPENELSSVRDLELRNSLRHLFLNHLSRRG